MPRCPRCLKPVAEDRKCVDIRCGYRLKGSSSRPLGTIFVLVGIVHLVLLWRVGVPRVDPPVPATYWLFIGLCCLFINSAATIMIYAGYVFAFEMERDEFAAWLKHGLSVLQAIAIGADLPGRSATPKSSSSRG
jgi:hypothetical protein